MKGCVYKAEVAGKLYIGKTTLTLDSRIKTHLNHAFRQHTKTPVSLALQTLTPEEAYKAFSPIEYVERDTYEELEAKLCELENYYMNKFDTFCPNGYNVHRSGPSKKKTMHTQPPRESVMRAVICVETGETFKSLSDASRSVGVDTSAVYHCLKGVTNTAGGKHWRYADGEYHECTRPEGQRNRKSQSKPVMCKETGIIYPSTGEAERQTGIGRTGIAKCACGRMISAGGYKWGYVVNGEPIFHDVEDKNRVKVKCLETGVVYDSIAECAKAIGDETPGTLHSCLKHGCKHKGFTYVRV